VDRLILVEQAPIAALGFKGTEDKPDRAGLYPSYSHASGFRLIEDTLNHKPRINAPTAGIMDPSNITPVYHSGD